MPPERLPFIPPTVAQSHLMARLAAEEPEVVRKDLKCPDCGAKLRLKIGRYGRFYGCVKYKKTGCKGSVTAKLNGEPGGIPAKARVRALRKQVMDSLEELKKGALGPFSTGLPFDVDDWPDTPVGQWEEHDCRRALTLMGVEPKVAPIPPRTRWERMLDDDEL